MKNNLGAILIKLGKFDDAENLIKEGISIAN